jgi:hypothetical protein
MDVSLKAHPEILDLYVTPDGRVFRELVGEPDPNGYVTLKVTLGHKCRTVRRHTLVLETFKGLRPIDGLECRHLDGNPGNDHPLNLAWGTHTQNMQDAVIHGTHVNLKHPNTKLTAARVKEMRARFNAGESGSEIAKDMGVSHSTVCDIMAGRTWKTA